MKKISLIAIVVLLVGCQPRPAPVIVKCSEGYNPYYKSTSSSVVFKCVKNE